MIERTQDEREEKETYVICIRIEITALLVVFLRITKLPYIWLDIFITHDEFIAVILIVRRFCFLIKPRTYPSHE